jgi:hypothetical protein
MSVIIIEKRKYDNKLIITILGLIRSDNKSELQGIMPNYQIEIRKRFEII